MRMRCLSAIAWKRRSSSNTSSSASVSPASGVQQSIKGNAFTPRTISKSIESVNQVEEQFERRNLVLAGTLKFTLGVGHR